MAVSSRSLTSPLAGQFMKHRPFGVDENDHPINHIQSRLIVGIVRYMQIYVGKQEQARKQSAAQIEATQQASLEQLVTQINEALPDPHTHVTSADLLQANRWYSLEFALFVGE